MFGKSKQSLADIISDRLAEIKHRCEMNPLPQVKEDLNDMAIPSIDLEHQQTRL